MRKAVVGETKIGLSSNKGKSIAGIGASQIYLYALCQPMPKGLYNRWELNAALHRFKASFKRARCFEKMVVACFQSSRSEGKFESFKQQGHDGILSPSLLIEFAVTVGQFLRLLDASIFSANVKNFNLD